MAENDLARGLIFPYSVIGTIILALMVGNIHKFAKELSKEKVIKKHIEARRLSTLGRAISQPHLSTQDKRLSFPLDQSISRPLEAEQIQQRLDERAERERLHNRSIAFNDPNEANPPAQGLKARGKIRSFVPDRVISLAQHFPLVPTSKKQKEILMRSEKDRFVRMRPYSTLQNASGNGMH